MDKKMDSHKKLNRSVTVQKKKDTPKPQAKPTTTRSKSKSPVKVAPLRKRDEKTARKVEAKIAKAYKSIRLAPRSNRSKSVAP